MEMPAMDSAPQTAARKRGFAALVDLAQREPGKALAVVLAVHLAVWTVLPMLLSANLQLDLVEDLALGKEWQLGYWKHPPLPWWIADLAYRVTGSVKAVYALGPLAAVVCFYGVWLLAREVTGAGPALLAVLTLEGIHFYNLSVVKFAHDQMQLPFWAFTGLFFYRALVHGRTRNWALAGACLAGAFWSKYAAFALAAPLAAVLLADPVGRRAWRTRGPFVMALSFAIVIAPNLWWLVDTGFPPFRYVDARARIAVHWWDHLLFPLQWTASQLLYLLPAVGLLALLYGRSTRDPALAENSVSGFDRRYVTALALGPFIVTTVAAAALGRLPVAMWGYPLWSFAPLAAILWLGPQFDPRALCRFSVGVAVVFVAMAAVFVADEFVDPYLRDRPKAAQFPGRLLAETVTRQWRARTGAPLRYVGGANIGAGPGEFPANNVAVYSPDQPHVIVHGDPALSPWIDREDLDRHGAVFVWEFDDSYVMQGLQRNFPRIELQSPLLLPRQTHVPREPARIGVAYLPPRR
jgi:hypothetical protein